MSAAGDSGSYNARMTAQSASANFVFARVICCENRASRTADAGSRARYTTKAVNFVRCASISKSTFGGAGKGAAGESLIARNASTGIDLSAQRRVIVFVSMSIAMAPCRARSRIGPPQDQRSDPPNEFCQQRRRVKSHALSETNQMHYPQSRDRPDAVHQLSHRKIRSRLTIPAFPPARNCRDALRILPRRPRYARRRCPGFDAPRCRVLLPHRA